MQEERERRRKENSISKKKKKRRPGNLEIQLVSYFFVCLFLVMIAYISQFSYTKQEEMINNSYNEGQKMLVLANRRGNIYSADGEILATTKVDADGKETREYPYGNLFSHVIGYSTSGRTGVEELANYYLIQSGASLSEKVDNDLAGKKNPGDEVYTTLNTRIQQACYDALGVYDGAIVATDPKTGHILAMVSKPDFDPNTIYYMYDELTADKNSSVLLNRAAQGLYPPGSTFKIVTALEYLKEHPDDYKQYRFTCTGSITIDGSKIRCFHGQNHGGVDFKRSFEKSCNSSFANISTKLDWDQFDETLDTLMFGSKLPFELTSGISYAERDPVTTEDRMQTSIGQGKTLMTPLHLNMITCAIANDGVLQYPYILSKVETASGNKVKDFSSPGKKTLMTSEQAAIMRELMESVVESGTATKLKGQFYTAAGKTGSAEYNSNSDDSHAWFTGYAPAESPLICVTVIIEGAGSGGDHAVPIARRVFDAYFGAYSE